MKDLVPRAELDAAVAEAVLERSPEAFMAVDLDWRVVAWNPAAELLTGWASNEVLGRKPPHWPGSDGEPPPAVGLQTYRRKDGSTFVALLERDVELRAPDGRVLGRGRFFRAAPEEDAVLGRRNELSRRFDEAVRIDDVRAVLDTAVVDLLQADRAVVLRPCGRARHLHGRLAIGANQEDAERAEIPLDEGHPAWEASQGRRIATGTIRLAGREDFAAFVPMGPAAAGWVLGLVFSGSPPEGTSLRGVWEAVASDAWSALRRVELVAELEGKLEILEATAAVSSSAGLDLDAVLQSVCRHAAAALSCERSAVYLRAEDGELVLAHLYATDLDTSVPSGQRAAEEFLRAAEPMVIQDAGACAFLEGPWHPLTGAVSVFGMPLRVGDRDLGVLVVAHTLAHPRGFTNLCQQVGDAVARQAALAIENARLFAETRAALSELTELDRLKADYMDGLSHDLRTPLTGLLGFVETLRRTMASASEEEQGEYLDIIERQARRIAGMVDDLLASARLEAGALTPERPVPVQVGELIAAALDALAPDHRSRIAVEADDLEVEVDRSMITRALQNLIDNALKHSPANSNVEVVVRREARDALIAVTDHGPGIDEQARLNLFSRFGRSAGRGNVGLGLYITRGIVRAHGGDVTVETGAEGGTTFTVQLPLSAALARQGGPPARPG